MSNSPLEKSQAYVAGSSKFNKIETVAKSVFRIDKTSPFQSSRLAQIEVANFCRTSSLESSGIEWEAARISSVNFSREGDLDSEYKPNNSFSGT